MPSTRPGAMVGRRLTGPLLQKLFAGAMTAVAIYILVRDLIGAVS